MPVISGLVSGFLGGFTGAATFIMVHDKLTWKIYTDPKYASWDFRYKNYFIFVCSDFCASFSRIFFETRKQLLQMCNQRILLSEIVTGCYLGITPLILRDFLFRTTLLSVFYSTTTIEHTPALKFALPEILAYIKHWKKNGDEHATIQNKYHLFIEHHNYKISTALHNRFLLMLLANLVGTLITNPIDVCLSKLLTQRERKYTGLINCLFTVYKEEGWRKFLSGIHPRFMFNSLNGVMFLYLYDQVITSFHEVYDQRYQQ